MPIPKTGILRRLVQALLAWLSIQAERIPYDRRQGPPDSPRGPRGPGGMGAFVVLLALLLAAPLGAGPLDLAPLPAGLSWPAEIPAPQWAGAAGADEVDEFVTSAAILGAGTAWDLYWTAFALNRNANAREANPLGFTAEARISLKLAVASGCAVADWKLRRHGHRRWANVVRYSVLAIQLAAGVNNIVVGTRGR